MTRGAAGAPASDDVGELMALPPVPAAKMGVASQDDVGSSELARKHRHSRAAYWIMCLLGAGLLLPWNAVVNAVDFFDSLYPNSQFEFYVALAYIWPQLPIVGAMVKWGDRVSFTIRIVSMFLVQAIFLILIPVLSVVAPGSVSFWTNLLMCLMIGISTAILQTSLFGFSSQLPPLFNQAIMAGQGVAGVGVSVLRMVTMGFVPNDTVNSMVFFAISCFFMVACVAGYFYILKMEFTQYHLERSAVARINATPQMKRARSDGYTSPKGARGTSPDEEVGLHRAVNSTGSEEGSYPAASPASTLTSTPGSGGRKLRRKFTLRLFLTRRFGLKQRDSDGDGAGEYLLGEEGEEGEEYHAPGTCGHFCFLIRRMWAYAAAACFIFVVTFAVFPGEITSIKYRGTFPKLHALNNKWWPVILVFAFNCCDLTGRTLAGYFNKLSGCVNLTGSLLRIVFVPLFVICVHNYDVAFFSDLFVLLMVMGYAITNGYLASVAMMVAPSMVPPHDREAAGFFMSLFLQAGIFIGAQVALGVRRI